MENNNNISYIKTDDNKIINENFIKWVKKMNECLYVCTKIDGCIIDYNTHRICKINSFDSYNKLNNYFK
jgi:hypothetical protein